MCRSCSYSAMQLFNAVYTLFSPMKSSRDESVSHPKTTFHWLALANSKSMFMAVLGKIKAIDYIKTKTVCNSDGIFLVFLVFSHRSWTKPTSYKENHNTTLIWKVHDCRLNGFSEGKHPTKHCKWHNTVVPNLFKLAAHTLKHKFPWPKNFNRPDYLCHVG